MEYCQVKKVFNDYVDFFYQDEQSTDGGDQVVSDIFTNIRDNIVPIMSHSTQIWELINVSEAERRNKEKRAERAGLFAYNYGALVSYIIGFDTQF